MPEIECDCMGVCAIFLGSGLTDVMRFTEKSVVSNWSKKPRSGTWVHPREKFTLELSARTSFASSGDMFSPFVVDFLIF